MDNIRKQVKGDKGVTLRQPTEKDVNKAVEGFFGHKLEGFELWSLFGITVTGFLAGVIGFLYSLVTVFRGCWAGTKIWGSMLGVISHLLLLATIGYIFIHYLRTELKFPTGNVAGDLIGHFRADQNMKVILAVYAWLVVYVIGGIIMRSVSPKGDSCSGVVVGNVVLFIIFLGVTIGLGLAIKQRAPAEATSAQPNPESNAQEGDKKTAKK